MSTPYTIPPPVDLAVLAWLLTPGIAVRSGAPVTGPCEWCDDLDCVATVRVYGRPRADVHCPVEVVEVGARCAGRVIALAITEQDGDDDLVVEVAA